MEAPPNDTMTAERDGAASEDVAGGPRVLLVDDEANILRSLRRLLRRDFDIDATTDAGEALEMLKADTYQILLSDQRMPAIEGTELAAKAREVSPDTVRLILTGYADIHAAIDAINEGAVYRFLTKPWNDDELINVLRQAATHYKLVTENKRLMELTEQQNQELTDLNEQLQAANAKLKGKVFERMRQVTQLNQELSSRFQVSYQMLSRLVEMYSGVLGSHCKRVAELSKQLGAQLDMSSADLFQLEVAASLHDIGKIGVDARFLQNDGVRIRAADRAIIMTHAIRGGNIIAMTDEFQEAAVLVRHHHEKYDGTGQPDRLKAGNIPLGSRIIAVADAFDNWLNQSSGARRSAKGALHFIVDNSGSHFDPQIVRVLVNMMRTGAPLSQSSSEMEVELESLQTGMILSRDLITLRGVLLLQKDDEIRAEDIPRLVVHHQKDPILNGIFIYESSMPRT